MLINFTKCHILEWRGSDPESVFGTRSPSKVNRFFPLAVPIITSMKSADYLCGSLGRLLLTDTHIQIYIPPPTSLAGLMMMDAKNRH